MPSLLWPNGPADPLVEAHLMSQMGDTAFAQADAARVLSPAVRERQLDLDLQAAARRVGGADDAAVRIDRALRDREAQSESRRAVARLAAIEGIEHLRELGRRNTGSFVAHRKDRRFLRGMHVHL